MVKKFLHFLNQKKEKVIRLLLGLLLVFGVSSLIFIKIEPIASWVSRLENLAYDLEVRNIHKPLGKNIPITIVDIDDKSLAAEGRWPWSRDKFAKLVTNLYQNGATVVAFDITFPEKEENIAEKVLDQVKDVDSPQLISELEEIKKKFDYDSLLANSLKLGESVLGMVFKDQVEISGVLPPPILQLTPQQAADLAIPDKKGYLANITQLQAASKTEGFINATPDPDGVLRFTPLLFRYGADVYGSLGLQGASHYLLSEIQLVTAQYDEASVLEGIKLDNQFIPTDAMGRMLIPFRGPSYSFPYISAADVLNGKISKESVSGKLIFVGSTASAIGDVQPTSVASIFPGIEVHASVASGIIDQYLPYKPTWGRGITLLATVVFGTIYALLLPFVGVLVICILCILLPVALIFGSFWLWSAHGIVVSVLLPLIVILLLFVLNLVWGYLFESRRSKDLKEMFGQYVPPAYLDSMLKQGGQFSLDGESKELSVLFSDIRSFTSVSEKMNASDLKRFLNEFFTPITEIIFNHKGTIDKYVGDMVMAFWGAPLEDDRQAFNAISAGMAMQTKLTELNVIFERENKPQIKIGVGVNTGVMNVGDMGSKFRRSYTVIGDTVNLGSRLEGQTKFYHVGILVGEMSYQKTKEDFAYRKIDKIKVKGKETGVEIYTPICLLQDASSELKKELEAHHLALDVYFEQNWDKAEGDFKQLQESYPANQELYGVYLERIQFMRENPPGPDWDGAYVSHEK